MEPHALKTPVLGPGEPRRPLSPSQRTRMRARRSRSADPVPLARGRALHSLRTRSCSRSCPALPSPRRRCPERDRASAPRRRPSRSAAASSGLKTRVWFLLSLSWTAGSRSRSPSLSTAERSGGSAWCLTRSLAAGSSWPRARLSTRTTPPTAVAVSTHADAGPPLQAEPGPADYPPSSSRPEDTCPRAGRAAPIAVAVSTHADAGRLLQAALSRTLLSTPAVVPPPWRRLSSGRASRADRCRRLAARCCGPPPPRAGPGPAVCSGRRPAALEAPVPGPGDVLVTLPPWPLHARPRRPGLVGRRGAVIVGRGGPGGLPAAAARDPRVGAAPLLSTSRRTLLRAGCSGLSRAPLSTPAAVPPPCRHLSSGRASRAATIDVSPHAVACPLLRPEPGSAVYSGRRPVALKTPVLGPGEPRRPLSQSQRRTL